MPTRQCEVLIIGAGPAGAVSAALLSSAGFDVAVFERARFPRFVIGESLLPICNDVLQEAGLFERVEAQGYQADIGQGWWGKLYHESGRGLLDKNERGNNMNANGATLSMDIH